MVKWTNAIPNKHTDGKLVRPPWCPLPKAKTCTGCSFLQQRTKTRTFACLHKDAKDPKADWPTTPAPATPVARQKRRKAKK